MCRLMIAHILFYPIIAFETPLGEMVARHGDSNMAIGRNSQGYLEPLMAFLP
jgi:hypothetical protein